LAPVMLGIMCTVGSAAMLWFVVSSWSGELVSGVRLYQAAGWITGAALGPVAAYFGYLVLMLIIDLARAVFCIARNTRRGGTEQDLPGA